MTLDEIEHARKTLLDLLPQKGRSAPRDAMTRAKLSKELGKGKDYVTDFIEGRKDSLGASEVVTIERTLKLPPGSLLQPGKPDPVRVPIDPMMVDTDPSLDPMAIDAARRYRDGALGPGEVVERDVTGGLGSGGNAPLLNVDGEAADGVRAVWRLPVDFLRTELRSREGDVDFIAVDGDSMIPTLLPGDRVMVNRQQIGPSDAIYAIHDGIGVSVKRLHIVKGSNPVQVKIMSDNPLHGAPDVILAADLKVIGRVVCRVSRF